jgi:hypothetical protein
VQQEVQIGSLIVPVALLSAWLGPAAEGVVVVETKAWIDLDPPRLPPVGVELPLSLKWRTINLALLARVFPLETYDVLPIANEDHVSPLPISTPAAGVNLTRALLVNATP